MGQQYQVVYENLQEFKQKFEIGQLLGSGTYGQVHVLNYIKKSPNDEELVVKQLNCSKFDKESQENEIESFKKVQLLPQEFRKRILEIKNVYWDPIKKKINMVIPRALLSLDEEISTKIENQTPYSQNEIIFKLSCALEGLFALETLGMAHRDIKTENMLIMKDGSLVISDLGTAKKMDYQIATMTVGIGTYKYWPSEQIDAFLKIEQKDYYEYIQSPQANKNFKTNDLYGVGLSFVLAASLSQLPAFKRSPQFLEIFKKDRKTFLEATFAKLKKEKNYTPDFISLLENLVTEDVYQRYSLLECAQKLCEIQGW